MTLKLVGTLVNNLYSQRLSYIYKGRPDTLGEGGGGTGTGEGGREGLIRSK